MQKLIPDFPRYLVRTTLADATAQSGWRVNGSMGMEIERKFLVLNGTYLDGAEPVLIRQGYISNRAEGVVRVRTCENTAYLTIKGKNTGCKRLEYEYEIPYLDGVEMLAHLCGGLIVEKYRYQLVYGGFLWEVDRFMGGNEGLVLAEIELEDEEAVFPKPDWLGGEVTGEPRYANANLAVKPFKTW